MAYITAARLKSYLGITSSTDDVLLTTLAYSAQSIVENHTHRVFECSADAVRLLDAVGDTDPAHSILYLREDLCSITTIVNGDGETITSLQYVTEPRYSTPYYELRLRGSADTVWTYTTDEEGAISITGKWAFSTIPPADVVQATIRLAAWLYRQKDNAADLDRAIVAGNATILPASIPADIKVILEPYKRLVG